MYLKVNNKLILELKRPTKRKKGLTRIPSNNNTV